MPKKPTDYRALNQELEQILATLSRADLDIDEAAAAYKRGKEIASQLEEYLKTAENTVKKVKQ